MDLLSSHIFPNTTLFFITDGQRNIWLKIEKLELTESASNFFAFMSFWKMPQANTYVPTTKYQLYVPINWKFLRNCTKLQWIWKIEELH